LTATQNFVAFDLGAESGRAVVGTFDGSTLRLDSVHRFPNGPVRVLDNLYWDVLRLFGDMKEGLQRCVQQHGRDFAGIGIDTWGVDFALLDGRGELLGPPHHYRDPRTKGVMEQSFQRVPREEIYQRTGIQFMPINSLYQLLAMARDDSPALRHASLLLMIPDLLNYWLSGERVCEFTDATTTQCYDPRAGDWAREMMERLGLPTHFLPEIVQPGATLGPLLASIAEETGCAQAPVIAPACHDTGSAVVAVPASGRDHVYISSGTWSLVGVEVDEPVINDRALELNFTNEGGAAGTFRLLKNVMGLWLVQECRRTWAREGDELSYDEIARLAGEAPAFAALVDPDDPSFLDPGDMPSRLREFCQRSGQPAPADRGAVLRCALDSLALKYRWVIESLDALLGRRLSPIHVVGGGSQNRLLCQLTADVTQRRVIAGPVEATAMGNLIVQAIGVGDLGSIDDGRAVVRASESLLTYEPQAGRRAACDDAYQRFLGIVNRSAG
jgi:rhamnulokinase